MAGSGLVGGSWGPLGRVVEPSHDATLKGDAVGIVKDPVEDGESEGGVANDIVPVLEGER